MPRSTSRCLICRKPVATEADYERYEDGEGKHLCWEDPDACIAEALEHGWPTTLDEALARAESAEQSLTSLRAVLEALLDEWMKRAELLRAQRQPGDPPIMPSAIKLTVYEEHIAALRSKLKENE